MKRFIEGQAGTQVTLLPECLMITSPKKTQFGWSTFSSMNFT
jgi:hypothetical protein